MGCESAWIKAAELGRGPPYTRTTGEYLVSETWVSNTRRVDRAIQRTNTADGRLVVQETERVHYALGLLGVEEDFDNLKLDND
jgi:hypothetical protein